MERRPTTRRGAAQSRRLKIFIWVAALAIVTISLIYLEQTAILYVLATLGVTALLVIVALADLSGAHKSAGVSAGELGDDAAAIADAIPGGSTAAAAAIKAPVRGSRRPRSKRR
jgi:hypothetical protein